MNDGDQQEKQVMVDDQVVEEKTKDGGQEDLLLKIGDQREEGQLMNGDLEEEEVVQLKDGDWEEEEEQQQVNDNDLEPVGGDVGLEDDDLEVVVQKYGDQRKTEDLKDVDLKQLESGLMSEDNDLPEELEDDGLIKKYD